MKTSNIFLITLLFTAYVHPAARHIQLKEEKKTTAFINTDELIKAIDNNNKEKATELIKSGRINLDFIANNYRTALRSAIFTKQTDIAKLLLAYGANVNLKDSGGLTVLIHAIYFHTPDIVKLLLEHGANVNLKGTEGTTPLMLACLDTQPDTIKLLLEYGANIGDTDDKGRCVFDYHFEAQTSDIFVLLQNWTFMQQLGASFFENNKSYDIKDFQLYPTLLVGDHSIENVISILRNKKNGNTLLHEAVIKKDYELINKIFKLNPKTIPDLLDLPNNENMTPIDLAVTDEYLLNYFMSFGNYSTKNDRNSCIIL